MKRERMSQRQPQSCAIASRDPSRLAPPSPSVSARTEDEVCCPAQPDRDALELDVEAAEEHEGEHAHRREGDALLEVEQRARDEEAVALRAQRRQQDRQHGEEETAGARVERDHEIGDEHEENGVGQLDRRLRNNFGEEIGRQTIAARRALLDDDGALGGEGRQRVEERGEGPEHRDEEEGARLGCGADKKTKRKKRKVE